MKIKMIRTIFVVLILMSTVQVMSASVSSESIPGTVVICEQPTYGINTSEFQKEINFGNIYPGESSENQTIYATIQQTPDGCGYKDTYVNVEIILGEWNTPEMTTEVINPNINPIYVHSGVDGYPTLLKPIIFIATAGETIIPGTYSQVITFSMIY